MSSSDPGQECTRSHVWIVIKNIRVELFECMNTCNIMAEGFRFIYLAFGFSEAENLSAQCMG